MKAEIQKYLEENDNDEMGCSKSCYMRKMNCKITKLKKERETQYKSLLADLKQLEQKQRKQTKPQMKGEEPTEQNATTGNRDKGQVFNY